MALAAAHKIPLEVAHTLVEIAEVARYAYEHRPGHPPAHDGASPTAPAGLDGGCASEVAARLREENAMLRARLADDLALLHELRGAPCVSQECPPDLYNRLLAAVNNVSFLAHLEKLQDESARQYAELYSSNLKGKQEVEIVDIPDNMGNGKKGSWVLVASNTTGANLEEISGIDDENYVIINEDDIVDGLVTFVARCILEDPKSKSLSPAELQKAVAKALDSMKARWGWSTFWEAGKVIYILATWGVTLAGDILGCDLINEGRDLSLLDQAPAAAISEKDAESSVLLDFLSQLKEEKEMLAAKLSADLASLQIDIAEVERRHFRRSGFMDGLPSSSASSGASANTPQGALLSGLLPSMCKSSIYEERVMNNLEQLENAYYSMRSAVNTCETNAIKRLDNEALRVRENFYQLHSADAANEQTDRLGCFFDGLCKYARHSKFEVRGVLKNADILNSPNVICSLSFDRDEEYFAAAGVSKKIKIFEFDSLLNDRVDIHYPLIEMPSKSKLSCVCWNSYIKNYLASTDYDGTVQLWDASSGQGFSQFTEHRKRAWSVSFSEVDPTKLASGSDDCCVKKNCIDTIRNVANVCCVQFSPYSSRMLAFGSADYKIYCYDLRNTRIPWCTISGHGKAVSYVRFLNPETLISASTDNTLKTWDLTRTNSSGLSADSCSLTLSGHTNEKNFVGLSVHDGYITCGSETNEVFSYYKTFPMPITSHKFGSIDPITGQVTNEDNQQFVSSVCWRGKSNMVVTANSSGSIKVLELV
ncbi:hypothetical protein EJB05_40364 [Eragrostis curvula]|uniref:Uncharacterized protein n=1 Tax=Eragrostis curvula TaxID=38414 RepID=A0A5J9TPL4_9POAL|nr:hypothetical protein EJB05_40364 [Eragrostis curvula]